MRELQVISGNQIVESKSLSAGLFERFINYLDASPKTVESYTKALRQLFGYFALNGIKKPTREDLIAFKEDLKNSGHKPTTIQNYITAARIFLPGQRRKVITLT